MTQLASPGAHVLVVDNDPAHAEVVQEALQRAGFATTVAHSGKEAVALLQRRHFDVVITDLVMSDLDGMEVLKKAKELDPDVEVILVTGHGTVESAVKAMQQGAFNYLLKPLDVKQLRAITQKAVENVHLRRTNVELAKQLDERFGFEGIVGTSPRMRRVLELVRRIAPTDVRVLITGETGTGKELIARAIHQNSRRKNKPFLALNCASFMENILDVELFGSVAGIYTDARDRPGKFEYANGGTLFLDEIGDMPLPTQSKLLRVLETGEVMRVGANEPTRVDVRVLTATNQNLRELVAQGKFRQDLYHRIAVVEVHLPPLRERREDIPLLVDHFLKMFNRRHKKSVKKVSPAVRARLIHFDWPGNVRQLANVIESMVVVDTDGVLDVDDLPPELADAAVEPDGHSPVDSLSALVGKPLEEIERLFIAETLKYTGGNREEAARLLGIGERTLYRKINKYQLH